ncbi:MAG: spore germination protein, partial [Clostridia bacterium]|nr:spore germination protein [Clostridia bacterium]
MVMRPAANLKGEVNGKTLSETFLSPETETSTDLQKAAAKIVGGESALIVDGVKSAFLFGLKKFDKRAIAEPPTSTVIKGPREGFVENLAVNVSLMRRKLSSPALKFNYLSVGKYSKTQIAVCYIDGVADKGL